MTKPPEDLTRRSFLQATMAGTAISVTKVSAMMQLQSKSSLPSPSSAGPSGDLTSVSIRDAADLIRTKKVSPVELTKACLARIDRLNPVLNAFITVTAESALQQAQAAEAELMQGK